MRHTISVFGGKQVRRAHARGRPVHGRGYNIDTLQRRPDPGPRDVAHDHRHPRRRGHVEQIVKQLNKLPDVIKVQDFREGEYVDRELVLVKVAVDSKSRAEVMQITDIFRAKNRGRAAQEPRHRKSPAPKARWRNSSA